MGLAKILKRLKDKNFLKKAAILFILTALCLTIQGLEILYFSDFPLWVRICGILLVSIVNISAVLFGYLDKKPLFRLMVTLVVFISFIMASYIALEAGGFFDRFRSFDSIKNFILSTEKWGKLIYVCIVVVQIVALPIPSALLEVVAANLFGSLEAFLLSVIGMLIGSSIAYFIGRVLGKKVVTWIVGKENVEKYSQSFNESGKFIFTLMMIFPFFPDDIICMVAGLSSMPFWFFFLVILFARPISSAVNCFLGSGDIIPFSGWGIPVWIAIFVLIGLAFAFFMHKNSVKNKRIEFSKRLLNPSLESAKEPKLLTMADKKTFDDLKKADQIRSKRH